MFDDRRFQCAAQIRHRIAFGPAGGDGIHEDLPAHLHHAPRRIQSAPVFNDAKHGKNFRRGDVGNWPLAQLREGYAFRDVRACIGGTGCPFVFAFFKPLAGDDLECIVAFQGRQPLGFFFYLARVVPGGEHLACLRTPLAGIGQG